MIDFKSMQYQYSSLNSRPLTTKPPRKPIIQSLTTLADDNNSNPTTNQTLPSIHEMSKLQRKPSRNSSLEKDKENISDYSNKPPRKQSYQDASTLEDNPAFSVKGLSQTPQISSNSRKSFIKLTPKFDRNPFLRSKDSSEQSCDMLRTYSSSRSTLQNSSREDSAKLIRRSRDISVYSAKDSKGQQQLSQQAYMNQKPASAQFNKKIRILSVKRSQNPDIGLLEEAHPLIQSQLCQPICKFIMLVFYHYWLVLIQIDRFFLQILFLSSEKIQMTAFPPSLTAKSWALFDGSSGKFIDGKCVHNQREVASLTKIMTCFTVIQFFESVLHKDMKKIYLRVSTKAASTSGTSARLQANMIISIWDLLFGLMLPSGNDSAVCLAEGVGSIMQLYYGASDPEILEEQLLFDNEKLYAKLNEESSPSEGMHRFLYQMNQHGQNLSLINTHYSNPHGLKNSYNKSSAYDVAKICAHAMKFNSFKLIVNTKQHTAQFFTSTKLQNYQIYNKTLFWENTNKLLEKGWAGIKTGVTDPAGPCLASCIKLRDPFYDVGRYLIIVILNAQTMDIRWTECQKIAAWAIESFNPNV